MDDTIDHNLLNEVIFMQSKTWKVLNSNLVAGLITNGCFAYVGYKIGISHGETKYNELANRSDKSIQGLKESRRRVEEQLRLANSIMEQDYRCDHNPAKKY